MLDVSPVVYGYTQLEQSAVSHLVDADAIDVVTNNTEVHGCCCGAVCRLGIVNIVRRPDVVGVILFSLMTDEVVVDTMFARARTFSIIVALEGQAGDMIVELGYTGDEGVFLGIAYDDVVLYCIRSNIELVSLLPCHRDGMASLLECRKDV